MQSPAAWHPDPTGSHDHRWWDGERWTEHVADAGVAAVDPLPGSPPSGSPDRTEVLDAEDAAAGEATSAIPAQRSDPGATSGHERATEQPAWGEAPTGGDTSPETGQTWAQPPHAGDVGGQPVWGQPSDHHAGPGGPPRAGGAAITALVLGILGLLSGIFVIGGLFGLGAIVFGIIALATAKDRGGGGKGHAIAGMVTGAVGVLLAVLVFGFFSDIARETMECLEETGNDQALCQDRLERSILDRFGAG